MPAKPKAPTADATDAVNNDNPAVPDNAAPPVQDAVAARLETLRKVNAEAVQTLGNHFGPRWPKLVQRAERAGMDAESIASLAGKMISTRQEWHPGNAAAALAAAACGFICAIGGTPSDADVKLFEDAKAAGALQI